MNFFLGDQDDINCNDYYVLNDATRNLGYGSYEHGYGDDASCYPSYNYLGPSPDWRGPGWYRLGFPSGITIPDKPVEEHNCNGFAPGWLNGSHPAAGNTVNGTVCFSWGGNTCAHQTQIQIKHCNNYFLYYLAETPDTLSAKVQ